jgi:hypothetical protein
MWRMGFFLLSLGSLLGCTVATPSVKGLANIPSFASKSASPFLQENIGSVFYFSGQCIPGVTGFEFRLNNFSQWSSVPSTPPTPGAGEYLVGTPDYDVDCSDGVFNFYLFESQALANYTLNGATQGSSGDPSSIEFRTLGVDGIPTIVYSRPPPVSFMVYSDYSTNQAGYVETNRTYNFRVRMLDAFGKEVQMGTTQTRTIALAVNDLSNSVASAGQFYEHDCTTSLTASDLTFVAGVDELVFCYQVGSPVIAGDTVQIQVSSNSMLTGTFNLPVMAQNSVITSLSGYNGSYTLPSVLVKGAQYMMQMNLSPLYNPNQTRMVSSFLGDIGVASDSTSITFTGNGTDSTCPATSTNGVFKCIGTTGASKSIQVYADPASSASSVTFTVTAAGSTGCSSGCSIYDAGTNYVISSYLPSQMSFNLVSGSATFDQPYFLPNSLPALQIGNCESLQIGAANSDGNPIPFTSSKTFVISDLDGFATFYSDYSCKTSIGSSTSVAFSQYGLPQQIYYILTVNTFPASGQMTWQILDNATSATWQRPFYLKKPGN